jgi:hypothetical protein
MARVLSLPFALSAAGRAITVEQGSDEYYKQQIATLVSTIAGEREIYETLGMPDMAFDSFGHTEFHTQMSKYLPQIVSFKVNREDVSDTTQRIEIAFDTLRAS